MPFEGDDVTYRDWFIVVKRSIHTMADLYGPYTQEKALNVGAKFNVPCDVTVCDVTVYRGQLRRT